MFNSYHYVPILKWKRAEQGALDSLSVEHKKELTPLIQFVMPKQKPEDTLEKIIEKFKKQLQQIPDDVIQVWGENPIFVDFSLLFTTELKLESIKTILPISKQKGAVFIPVLHLSDEDEIKNAVCSLAKANESGFCLRLVCADFGENLADSGKINAEIKKLLSDYKLNQDKIDLLVDVKELGVDTSKYDKYFDASQNICDLQNWRTYIFASGSFPENLTSCKIDEENLVPRSDWTKWIEKKSVVEIIRKPSFSDYTIQFPIYKDISQFFHPTSSIKYTIENEWYIMKGKKQKFSHYLANAALLVNSDRYYGENFSFGDKYIKGKADHYPAYIKNPALKGTGSTETWLKAGINHHLTLVATQVSSLNDKK